MRTASFIANQLVVHVVAELSSQTSYVLFDIVAECLRNVRAMDSGSRRIRASQRQRKGDRSAQQEAAVSLDPRLCRNRIVERNLHLQGVGICTQVAQLAEMTLQIC